MRWVAPSPALPAAAPCLPSNNNCAICFHDGRLFLAWRTAEIHFASANAAINVVSSTDQGRTWDFELRVALGADVREPSFVSIGGKLTFTCFEGGTNPAAFEPRNVWHVTRTSLGVWGQPVRGADPHEVPWEVKVRKGRAWMTSYRGNHYGTGPSQIDVSFKTSTDGTTWTHVDPQRPVIYSGGVSEVGWEFDEAGALWAVTRNEDGDATGWGSHLATAPATDLARWQFPAQTDPERYDSPRMIRHGDDLYLIGRRDVGGPFDLRLRGLSFDVQKWLYLGTYSARPKGTSLYRIDRQARRVVRVMDLPGCGDTSFPSVWRVGAHEFLIANYTSPLNDPNRTWISGQLSPQGTQVYLATLTFVPR